VPQACQAHTAWLPLLLLLLNKAVLYRIDSSAAAISPVILTRSWSPSYVL
jgi:hypothetical protein